MKYRLLVLLIFTAAAYPSAYAQSARTRKNIDFNWRFHLGDIKDAQSTSFHDNYWKRLDLPHDFSIEGKYDSSHSRANAFLPGGTGWYRKTIDWNKDWKGKLVFIQFDGVYMNSRLWINGHFLGERVNGYIGFRFNLTPYLKKGKNMLAVRVDNSKTPSARWYSGSGIYRHVWLITTDKIHITHNGTYIRTPEITEHAAQVLLTATIDNASGSKVPVVVASVIVDKEGKEVAENKLSVPLDTGLNNISDSFIVHHPSLWSPQHPDMYYVKTIIKVHHRIQDIYTTPFGIRQLVFSPVFGFKLNGKSVKFRGVCDHQSISPAGAAVPDDMIHYRLEMLKKMGCNAIRTSHNPQSPVFYNMCDTMGIMVMDEAFDGWDHTKAQYDYGLYWNKQLPGGQVEWKKDLTDFIKRDRNHPCIVIWSQGNEVWGYEKELNVQKEIYEVFHTSDATRPVTQAWADKKYLDIAGFNANGEQRGELEKFHQAHPDMPMIGTEMPHTRQTRGVYRTMAAFNPWDKPYPWTRSKDSARKTAAHYPLENLSDREIFTQYDPRYASGYDNQTLNISIREAYKQVQRYPFFMGEFRWTGFDYLGESWGWPARTNNYGVIDLAGFPKDAYYLYQSLWTAGPMIHLLPHWTHPGMEGIKIPVVVYTNGDAAELLLNGKSLGKKPMDKNELQIVWQVPYHPGKLVSVAYRDGRIVAKDSSVTSGKAAAIRLIPDRTSLRNDRTDVVRIEANITDTRRNFDPIAQDTIHFEVKGPYKLLGVENGDILDTSANKVLWRKAFMGKALLVLQSTGKPGTIEVKATGSGLRSGITKVYVTK